MEWGLGYHKGAGAGGGVHSVTARSLSPSNFANVDNTDPANPVIFTNMPTFIRTLDTQPPALNVGTSTNPIIAVNPVNTSGQDGYLSSAQLNTLNANTSNAQTTANAAAATATTANATANAAAATANGIIAQLGISIPQWIILNVDVSALTLSGMSISDVVLWDSFASQGAVVHDVYIHNLGGALTGITDLQISLGDNVGGGASFTGFTFDGLADMIKTSQSYLQGTLPAVYGGNTGQIESITANFLTTDPSTLSALNGNFDLAVLISFKL